MVKAFSALVAQILTVALKSFFRPLPWEPTCMKALTHPASTAFGLAVLCCLVLIAPIISLDHLLIFHDSGRPAAIFLPLLADLAIVWFLLTLLLMRARKPGRIRVAIWSGVILIFPWLLLEDGSILQAWSVHHRLGIALLLWSCLCWVGVNVFWRPTLQPHFERLVRFWKTVFVFLTLNNVVVVVQLLWCFWAARAIQTPRPLHAHTAQLATVGQTQRPRVIWIILDELSYRQVYERRFPGLELPAFDQLAAQSTVFTHVQPAGIYTEEILPSLLTGVPVNAIRPEVDGVQFSMHDPVNGQWVDFREHDTIFQDALDDGYSTGIAGWYEPYCRILPNVLDHCYWSYERDDDKGMFVESTPLQNTLAPFLYAASRIAPHWADSRYVAQLGEAQIADFHNIYSAGDRLLSDSSINFLMLHLPVPHPGAIYDRETGDFASYGGSYIDNLALADRYLAHVHQLLQQRGEWDSSAVIVMGDHSWRTTALWEGTPFWMQEDQRASDGGKFDPRPAYIVKLPGQTEGARIETPFPAIGTRALLQSILSGRIRTPQDVAKFAHDTPAQHQEQHPMQETRSVAQLADSRSGGSK
jgi:arylsulfatase A-like enzyme